jgi:hypothetical protein
MMKFMLLFSGDDALTHNLSQHMVHRLAAAHRQIQSDLTKSGELMDHSELAMSNAAVVQVLNGERVVTENPSSSGGHVVSGFYMLDCPGLDRAIEIASRFVEIEFAQIEIRHISRTNTWEDGAHGRASS